MSKSKLTIICKEDSFRVFFGDKELKNVYKLQTVLETGAISPITDFSFSTFKFEESQLPAISENELVVIINNFILDVAVENALKDERSFFAGPRLRLYLGEQKIDGFSSVKFSGEFNKDWKLFITTRTTHISNDNVWILRNHPLVSISSEE